HLSSYEQLAATLHFEEQIWTATLAEIGGKVDYEATIDRAMEHGRESWGNRYTAFFAEEASTPIDLVIDWDEDKAAEYLEKIAPAIDIDASNAQLYREDGEIRLIDSEEGRALDRDAALDAIESAILRRAHA